MRKNFGLGLALLCVAAFAACGPGQATITADIGEGDEANVLEDLEVRLLPYDRDQVFDSLIAAADTPEPEVPTDLLAARDEIADAQRQYLETESQWNTLRDTLAKLSAAMEGLSRAEGRYRVIFSEWSDLNDSYQNAEAQVDRHFERFQSLQSAAIGRMDSMNVVRADWEDQAFRDVDAVIAAKIEASGLEPAADTTDAAGAAHFAVAPGRYWVYARHELPYDELYWNVEIEIARGEPATLRLSRENAEVRPVF